MIGAALRFFVTETAGPALERVGQAIGNRIAILIDPHYHPPERIIVESDDTEEPAK